MAGSDDVDQRVAELGQLIRDRYPESRLTPLDDDAWEQLRLRTDVPLLYKTFMREVGYGSIGDRYVLYPSFRSPTQFADPVKAEGIRSYQVFGRQPDGAVDAFLPDSIGWRVVCFMPANPIPFGLQQELDFVERLTDVLTAETVVQADNPEQEELVMRWVFILAAVLGVLCLVGVMWMFIELQARAEAK